MIFVDTGAWFAVFVPNDSQYASAAAWFSQNREPLVTTDFVLDELLTLLKKRREFDRAIHVGEGLWSGETADVAFVAADDLRAAWGVFRSYRDKEWSFTDCVSRVVMERLGVTKAFAFDRHFRQFGNIDVVP